MKITKKVIKHSSLGDFLFENRKPKTMLNGGHGQENINYLNKHKVAYDIIFEYNNGVRLGNVSIHNWNRCKTVGKQCWFPDGWTRDDIKAAGEHVLSLKKNQGYSKQAKVGFFRGVKVGVYDNRGRVATIFPWFAQRRKNENKKDT